MTVNPPPPSGSPPPGSPPPERRPLGSDELIAVFVAFLCIGAIFFGILGRNKQTTNLFNFFGASESESRSPSTTPTSPSDNAAESDDTAASGSASSAIVADQLFPEQDSAPLFSSLTERDPQTADAGQPSQSGSGLFPFIAGATGTAAGGAIGGATSGNAASPSASATPRAEATPIETGFSDVPSNYWAAPFIAALVDRGILKGFPDGTFKPNQAVTRAEFAAMIEAAFEQNSAKRTTQSFKDIQSGYWAAPSINRAYEIGFLEGYPGGVFRPDQEIPKVQALVALTRGLDLQPPENPQEALRSYNDAQQIPNYATNAVAAATQSGLVVNHPNPQQLAPNKQGTRAEIAALIYQALAQTGSVERINSDYVVQPERRS